MLDAEPQLAIAPVKAKAPPSLAIVMHAPVLIHSYGGSNLLLITHAMPPTKPLNSLRRSIAIRKRPSQPLPRHRERRSTSSR